VSASEVLVVPFVKQGGKPYWDPATELRVHKAIGRMLKLCPTMYQNAQFDVYALETQGYTVGNIAHDTMILHHAIHPELPHNLGYIVSIYGETPYWKDIVLQSDEAMWMLDDIEVRTYNARDAAVLHQILEPMLEDLKDVGTENTYYNFGMKLLRPLMTMKRNGILVDTGKLKIAQAEFKGKAKSLKGKIQKLCGLPDGFNLDSGDHLRWLLYGVKPASYEKNRAERQSYEDNPKKRRDTKKFQELEAKLQVVSETTPLLIPSGTLRTTESGKASCDDAAFLTIQRYILNRLEAMEFLVRKAERHVTEKSDLEQTLKFIELFRSYSESHKLATTYSKYPIGDDGRVHPSYKIHGTATGRLSSSEPNAQNQAGLVLCIFVAPEGKLIVKADYSNIEVRVMAYLSNEQVLIDALESGLNIHDVNTKIMFGIDESHPDWKNIRRAAKVFVFGRSYGGSIEGIYREVITQVPEARLTLAKFQEADRRYFEKLGSYRVWCEKQKKQARETRTVMTAFGRKRFLLGTEDEIERQALNTPTQGTAGEITEMAIIELHGYLQKHPELDAKMIVTVHDSILCEAAAGQAVQLGKAMKKIMEKKIVINNRTVSFPVDIEIGPSWGETEKVEL
jgi:DNA polymerase I-like protein with 3'-5' exonuclease and polymerase domains